MSLLEVDGLIAFYGDFQALFGISLQVAEGETVALIGSNGAGKSTLLRALTGLMPIGGGAARFAGVSLALLPAHRIVARGLALVPKAVGCSPVCRWRKTC